jgi:hypothetical protein
VSSRGFVFANMPNATERVSVGVFCVAVERRMRDYYTGLAAKELAVK